MRGRSKLWLAVFVCALGYAIVSERWSSVGYLLLRIV